MFEKLVRIQRGRATVSRPVLETGGEPGLDITPELTLRDARSLEEISHEQYFDDRAGRHPPGAAGQPHVLPDGGHTLLALAAYYFIGVDQGAWSVFGNDTHIHEFVHDARHFLGFPCH